MAICSLENTSFRDREKLSRGDFRNQLWRTKITIFIGSPFFWSLIFIFTFCRFAAFYLLMGFKRLLGISKEEEPPLSFLKDESTDIIAAIHSIILIKEMHWTRKQPLIQSILGSRVDAYSKWIKNLKEFPEDLLAVLSKEQMKLIKNDTKLLKINVQECPEWQTAFKDWKERTNLEPNSPMHMNWAYALARWRLLNKGKSHRKNIKGMVKVYAELKKDLQQQTLASSNTTNCDSNAKEEKRQYYQEKCLCKLHNINCLRCRTPSAAERFKRLNRTKKFNNNRQNEKFHPSPTGGMASPTEVKAYQSLSQEPGYVIVKGAHEQTQEEPSFSDSRKFADDDELDMRDISMIEVPVQQNNELNIREEEKPTSSIDDNRQQIDYGTTSQNSTQDAQQTSDFGFECSNDFYQYGISLAPFEAQLYQQHNERNGGTSPPRESEMVLDTAKLVSTGQQKERNPQNLNERQLNSRTQLSNSDGAYNANYQERREQSEFSHVQQRSTSYASDSLENGRSFVERLIKKKTNVQQGSAIHGGSSQKAKQALPSENGGESLGKTSDKDRAQASVESFQQEESIVQESFVSHEEQSSVAQGAQSENKEESAQSNRNEKAEYTNCNSVQMESSTKQSSILKEGSSQQNQENPRMTTIDPAVTKKEAKDNDKAMKKPHNIDEDWGSEARIRTAQKSPQAYSLASSKRPPLQPFPRIDKKKAAISHYSPSINLTNKEGIAAYNLILVGDSNVGKTTLFNSSANYLLSGSEAEAFRNPMFLSDLSFRVTENSRSELISVQANFKSDDGLARNNSQYPLMEEITYYDPESGKMKMLRILDTPGINDENGAINVENILKAAKFMGEIHGIGILIGPNEVRMKPNFALALNRLLGQFHQSAIKNLLFFYTKVSGPTYAPGDGYPLVQNYLKAAKIDLLLDLENVFRFDNGWFRSLCIKQFNSKNGKMYKVPVCTGWSHSKNEMERLMERLSKSKEPYKMEESVFLDETKRFLEELAEPVSQCLLKYIEKSYEIEGITEDKKNTKDQPQLMAKLKEEAELKKTFDVILKKCSQLAAFLQKNTIVPDIDPFLEHFTSLRDIEKEKDKYNRVKSHHLPKLQSTCEKYVAELNNAIPNVTKPNIEEIKAELVSMPHFMTIFFNAFGVKMKF